MTRFLASLYIPEILLDSAVDLAFDPDVEVTEAEAHDVVQAALSDFFFLGEGNLHVSVIP